MFFWFVTGLRFPYAGFITSSFNCQYRSIIIHKFGIKFSNQFIEFSCKFLSGKCQWKWKCRTIEQN